MEDLVIRTMKTEESVEAASVIARVFDQFIAPDYSLIGVQHFYEFILPEAMVKRLSENSTAFIACYRGKIIGVIEIRDYSHVSLLFVSEEWHGQGIAKRLIDAGIAKCRAENRAIKQVSVNSSPYAVPVYEKLGFTIREPEQEINGIRFTPMRKAVT